MYSMDLFKLLTESSAILTMKVSPEKAILVMAFLTQNRLDIKHILSHVESITADGKLTMADIPDIVMFSVELFTFISNTTAIPFSKDDIFTLAENAAIIIISSPRFSLNTFELKLAINVADTCFVLAKKVVKGNDCCSNWCAWFCRRTSTHQLSVPPSSV